MVRLFIRVILIFTWLISKSNVDAYWCQNGNFIPNSKLCNGRYDCKDRSDEIWGCEHKRNCGKEQFHCGIDNKCMNISVYCNGINDCADKSDEYDCVPQSRIEVSPENCLLKDSKYLCKNKLACLDFSRVCDGYCDCIDCSDESDMKCSIFDKQSCTACPQFCVPTPDGPRCACDSNTYESSALCKEIRNCTGDASCDQQCYQYKNSKWCSCYEGYHEVSESNGRRCQSSIWLKTVLIYSTVSKLKVINSTSKEIKEIQHQVHCTSLSSTANNVYYATFDENKGSIYKSLISGGDTNHLIYTNSPVTSLSVDWITGNFYFTSNKSLSVCTPDGQICTQQKCCEVDFVVLAPKIGLMFYTQNKLGEDDQFIMKSYMDGTEENMFLPDQSFHYPISLAVDDQTEMLYWWEVVEKKLHSISYDGSNQRIHVLSNKYLLPFTILDGKGYFIKKRENIIYGALNAASLEYEDKNTTAVKYVHIHNAALQHKLQVKNPCETSECTGLCLLRPSFTNSLSYSCICESFASTNENHWCDKSQIYSKPKYDSSSDLPSSDTQQIDVSWSTEGYTTTSLNSNSEYTVLYSTATKIKVWYTSINENNVIRNDVDVTALSGTQNAIYYATLSSDGRGHIFKTLTFFDQNDEVISVESRITSIATDWITGQVYFTAGDSLLVCSHNWRICTQLKRCATDYVAVAPRFGWLYYTKKLESDGKRIIMKCNMDGSDEYILLDESFHYPVSLMTDEASQKLYWLEIEEQKLHSVTFYGYIREVHILNQKYLHFTAIDSSIFFTDENTEIIRYSAGTIYEKVHIDYDTNSIKYVQVYSPLQNENKNPCANATCSGLCLLHPAAFESDQNYTCLCDNFISSDDDPWCIASAIYSLSEDTTIGTPETSSITEGSSTTRKLSHSIASSSEPSSTTSQKPTTSSTERKKVVTFANPTTQQEDQTLEESFTAFKVKGSVEPRIPYCEPPSIIGIIGFVVGVAATSCVIIFYALLNKFSLRKRQAQVIEMNITEM